MRVTLEKINGVESVKVQLNTGLATILLKPGNSIRLEQVIESVQRNGFTPKEAIVTARGDLISATGKLRFKLTGVDETYDLSVDPKAGKILEDAKRQARKTLFVEGIVPPSHPPKNKKFPQQLQLKAIKEALAAELKEVAIEVRGMT